MSILDSLTAPITMPTEDPLFDEGQVAAAAYLARYSGRTLDAYRYDLRTFFQWASDVHLAVLEAKRPHIELYRTSMEQRDLAPSTIDRRLSTVCGFYRFAHIDGRVPTNPAQYVRRPKVHPSEGRGLDRREFGTFLYAAERCDQDHAALAVLLGLNGLRVSEACGTNIEDLAIDRGHRTLRIMGKGSKPAVIPLVPRAARTLDLAIGERPKARSFFARTVIVWIVVPLTAGSGPSASRPGSVSSTPTCFAPHSSWLLSTPAFRCGTSRLPPDMPIRGRPQSTTGDERTSTVTPPMSLWPSWLAGTSRRLGLSHLAGVRGQRSNSAAKGPLSVPLSLEAQASGRPPIQRPALPIGPLPRPKSTLLPNGSWYRSPAAT